MRRPIACRSFVVFAAFVAAAFATPFGAVGCKSRVDVVSDAALAPIVEPPAQAPEGLLAEVTIAAPDATWGRVQREISGALALLASTFGGIACAASGLDPIVATYIDGAAPAYAVFLEPNGDSRGAFVVAMRAKNASSARAELTTGDAGRFSAETTERFDVLTPRVSPASAFPAPILALSHNGYFVIASDLESLKRGGAYAVRTLSIRPRPAAPIEVTVPRSAFDGPVRRQLKRAWEGARAHLIEKDEASRKEHGGRAPDFGDPKAIVASLDRVAESIGTIASDVERATLTIDFTTDALVAEFSWDARVGDGPARKLLGAMATGDVRPLRSASPGSKGAVLFRSSAPRDAAIDIAEAIADGLGSRLSNDDKKSLVAAADDWATGRGAWVTAAIRDGALIIETEARDAAKLDRAIRSAIALLDRPGLREPVKRALRSSKPRIIDADLEGFAKGHAALFGGARGVLRGESFGVAWGATATQFKIVIGEDPSRPFATATESAEVSAALDGLGESMSAALVSTVPGDGASGGSSGGSKRLVVGWGKRGEAGFGRLVAPAVIVRELLRYR